MPPLVSSRAGACHAGAGFTWGSRRPGRLVSPIAPCWAPLVVEGFRASFLLVSRLLASIPLPSLRLEVLPSRSAHIPQ